MLFSIVEVEGAVQILDADGNIITGSTDGGDQLFHALAKLRNVAGTQINPATEDTVASIRDTAGIKKITDELPAGTKLVGKVQLRDPGDTVDIGSASDPVRVDPTGTTIQPISAAALPLPAGAATEATVLASDGRLTTIDSVLDSIRDTAGIKKITDELPAGTRLVGKFQIRDPGDSVDLGDAANPVRNDPTGTTTQPVSAASLPLPAGAATESTLSAADTKLGTIDAVLDTIKVVLDAIKDTAGIKKITDELPAGGQLIGKATISEGGNDAEVSTAATTTLRLAVASRLTDGTGWLSSILNNSIRRMETRGSVTSPNGAIDADVGTAATGNNRLSAASRLTDGTGWLSTVLNNSIRRLEGRNSITAPDGSLDVDVIVDNLINRLEVRSSIIGQIASAGTDKRVTVIDDLVSANVLRLQTQALLAPGSTVNIGTSIPADPANLIIEFLKTTGGSNSMLVDGTTPVEFKYQPAAGKTIAVDSVLLAFSTDDMYFDGLSFGPNVGMTNGILLELTVSSVSTEIFTIQINEDFLRVPGRIPMINNTGPKDVVSAAFSFGGLIRIVGDNSDHISVVVRDDLTSVKFKYLTATIYGAEVD